MKDIFHDNDFEYLTYEESVAFANKKIQNKVESFPIVYGHIFDDVWTFHQTINPQESDTHKAYIIFLEELPKKECQHEPVQYAMNTRCIYSTWNPVTSRYEALDTTNTSVPLVALKCKHCGEKLKTTWSIDE